MPSIWIKTAASCSFVVGSGDQTGGLCRFIGLVCAMEMEHKRSRKNYVHTRSCVYLRLDEILRGLWKNWETASSFVKT